MNRFLFLSLFFLFAFSSSAQYKNITLASNRANEVTMAVNPVNNLNIIGCANIDSYFTSTDGGLTWSDGHITSSEAGVWGDPCVIFDASGKAYYFHLARPLGGQFLDRIVCQTSTDNGFSWFDPGTFMGINKPKQEDKHWACADLTENRKNYIYVSWTQFDKYGSKNPNDHSNIMFSRSTDQGKSWADGLRINSITGDCLDDDSTVEGAVPFVAPDGNLYDVWSGPAGIVMNKSTDGGLTWMDKEQMITPHVNGWSYDIPGVYRCNGMPVSGSDISNGIYKRNLYINFSDNRNGNDDVDIFLIKSSDGGRTWSNVKRVNDDSPGNKKHQFMSFMSVDPVTGTVNILFYDRRNYNDEQTDVYLASSTDGGETFKNIKISDSPFKPDSSIFFGDYIAVSSYNDFVASFWTRMDNYKTSVVYCGIDFNK